MSLKLTESEIEAARTSKGGWTKATLASWGVPWPPPHGWKAALLAGEAVQPTVSESEINTADLLHKVVMAVINAGRGDILKGIDDLNAYYGCRVPTVEDIVGGRPKTAIISGGITWDDKVYSFQVARLIKPKNSSGMFRTIGAMDSLAQATEAVDAAPIGLDEMPQESVDAIKAG